MVCVGNTPLLKVDGVYAKLECANPLGSIKDRIAKYIIEKSENAGLLRPGMTIIEATSGNTGIAFSYFARQKGYPVVIVMPENMTAERKMILRNLGAELILCSEGDFAEATRIRDDLAQDPKYFNPDQFSNPLNVECHYETTAKEILDQISSSPEPIDVFVSGVGTGGTLVGCGRRLKEAFPDMRVVAVEPLESPVMSGGKPGLHGIQGIGDGFVPSIISDGRGGLDQLVDEVACCSTKEAKSAAQYLGDRGICIGMSSGANFTVARQMTDRYGTAVTIFPDGFSKYKSQGLHRRGSGSCPHVTECNCPSKPECDGKTPNLYCKCR